MNSDFSILFETKLEYPYEFPPLNISSDPMMTPSQNISHDFSKIHSNRQMSFLKEQFDLLSIKREKDTGEESLGSAEVEILGVGKRGPLNKKLEEELANWIRKQDHVEKPNSKTIRDKALELFQGSYPEFKASRGWYYNFLRRYKIRRYKSDILL